jgi:NAD-dependent deacetylase
VRFVGRSFLLLVCLPRGKAPLRRRIVVALRRLGVGDLVDQPVGDTGRAERVRIHAGMACPPVGDRLAVALDHVLVAEPRAADVHAARVNVEAVVEVRGFQVPNVRLERQGLDAVVAKRLVAVAEAVEVVDARDLEPDEVVRVVRDPLRVGLGEADSELGVEVEAVDGKTLSVGVGRLAELLRERGPAVVLTGAGISTESGIPDFRSPTGIWAQYDPQEYATIDAFRADPKKVWQFYALRFRALTEAEPNTGHVALAELERAGHVSAVVTQNIDLLHERAGSRDVVEVHGSIRTSSCLRCGAQRVLAEVLPLVDAGEVPECPACRFVLKPDVVFFGELLPEAAIDRAYELARSSGVLLVVGSQLEVWPVSLLPEETAQAGGAVAIVNRGPTSFDDRAAVKIDGGAGETLTALVRELAGR